MRPGYRHDVVHRFLTAVIAAIHCQLRSPSEFPDGNIRRLLETTLDAEESLMGQGTVAEHQFRELKEAVLQLWDKEESSDRKDS